MDRVQLLNDMKRSATWSQKLEGRSAPYLQAMASNLEGWPKNDEGASLSNSGSSAMQHSSLLCCKALLCGHAMSRALRDHVMIILL